jgi:UDP-N-acetylmuramyl tripeptide synthase
MEWWRRADSARCVGAVPEVSGISHDSRAVRRGEAFAALPGRQHDGHDYLESALAAGAAAAVVQADREAKWAPLAGRLPLVVVPDVRAALGGLAAAVHDDPSSRLRLIGVTGTDGKTTTSHLIAHVLEACGLGCGYLTSVGFDTGSGFELNATHMTTLEATSIQSLLAQAVAGFGLSFRLHHGSLELPARVPLLGRFNAYNSLAAVAVAASQGVAVADAVAALASFPGVPGRLERIEEGQPFGVFVDIASTAAALENVLTALRPATAGRLWVVFGAAGGRDPIRRSSMGEVAARLANRCVLTNEDPRDEDPDAIIDAIAGALTAGGRREGADFVRVPDRRSAIRYAFEQAQSGDTVLLAGKATETTMVFANEAVPWDERAVARELLSGRR